eukprot:m.93374 g.93374  ORF g.93374 m.93374 type:complete len:301 (+) comp9999_c0_seq1:1643-2545(+)
MGCVLHDRDRVHGQGMPSRSMHMTPHIRFGSKSRLDFLRPFVRLSSGTISGISMPAPGVSSHVSTCSQNPSTRTRRPHTLHSPNSTGSSNGYMPPISTKCRGSVRLERRDMGAASRCAAAVPLVADGSVLVGGVYSSQAAYVPLAALRVAVAAPTASPAPLSLMAVGTTRVVKSEAARAPRIGPPLVDRSMDGNESLSHVGATAGLPASCTSMEGVLLGSGAESDGATGTSAWPLSLMLLPFFGCVTAASLDTAVTSTSAHAGVDMLVWVCMRVCAASAKSRLNTQTGQHTPSLSRSYDC